MEKTCHNCITNEYMVEWKRIEDVSNVIAPPQKLVKQDYKINGAYPIIDQGQTEIIGYTDDDNCLLNDGEYVLFGDHTRFVKYYKGRFAQGADGLKILQAKKNVLPRYFYYAFLCAEIPSRGYSRHWSIAKDILIPIPPLSEQNRIVGILDTFTSSIDNLKEQIAQRRKQYQSLIDMAFGGTFAKMKRMAENGEIKIESLSEHGTFTRGRRFVRTDVVDEGQPCIHYGDMYTFYGLSAKVARTHLPVDFPKKMRYANKGDVIIVGAGENNEDIGVGLVWLGDEPAAVHDACYIYENDFNPMFVSYFLRSGIYHLQIKSHVVKGKICSISSDGIGKALIPIYPMEKQKEIVEKLIPFEKLLDNLQQQLDLRQKQYEYYRNKLLTFE